MLRSAIWIIMLAGLAALAASYGGALHPLGDALAVFRLHIGLGCLAASLLALRISRGLGLAGLAAAALATGPVVFAMSLAAGGTPGPVSVYQKNMLYQPRDLTPLTDDIRAAGADLLTLQEVTPGHAAMLASLKDLLPSQLICPFARVGAVAVASRWPMIDGASICLEGQGIAAIRVMAPDGPLWLVSLHLHWPWPHGQAPQRDRLLPVLDALEGPVLIGGDFNMVPWSYSIRRIARATGTVRIGRAFNSMTRFPLAPLPIDHILVPGHTSGTTEPRPLLGSDHHGILARITL